MNVKQQDLLFLSCLRQNARVKLTDLSRATRIPVSTLFDKIRAFEARGLIRRNTSLVRFEKFGFQAKALVVFSAKKKDRQKLLEVLDKSSNVNSLFRVNNEWDYMAEVVFLGVKEVEDFLDDIEELVKVKKKKIFYVIDELKRESFLANPKAVRILGGFTE